MDDCCIFPITCSIYSAFRRRSILNTYITTRSSKPTNSLSGTGSLDDCCIFRSTYSTYWASRRISILNTYITIRSSKPTPGCSWSGRRVRSRTTRARLRTTRVRSRTTRARLRTTRARLRIWNCDNFKQLFLRIITGSQSQTSTELCHTFAILFIHQTYSSTSHPTLNIRPCIIYSIFILYPPSLQRNFATFASTTRVISKIVIVRF